MSTPHLNPVTVWACPNCGIRARTTQGETNRYHNCPGLKGITAPMQPEGSAPAQVIARVREDYVGGEVGVRKDADGKPIMSVETIRDDGNDVVVFAPCATTRAEGKNI